MRSRQPTRLLILRCSNSAAQMKEFPFFCFFLISTASPKRQNRMDEREELMAAIQNELDEAADEECPRCASIRDE